MKKVLALLLAAVMVLAMAACGQTEPATTAADTPANTASAPASNEPAATEAPAEVDSYTYNDSALKRVINYNIAPLWQTTGTPTPGKPTRIPACLFSSPLRW